MTRTKIEWCTHTSNPLRARKLEPDAGQRQALKILATGHYCEKVSEECRNCYASKWQPRFGMPEFAEQRRSGSGTPSTKGSAFWRTGSTSRGINV